MNKEEVVEVIEVEEEKPFTVIAMAKETASNLWNGKPGKVIRTVGLVAVGFLGALALCKAGGSDDDIEIIESEDGFEVVEKKEEVVEVTEF